jgi:hypothetical protein
MTTPKPQWGLLYTLLPVAVGLLVAAHRLSPSAGWRVFAECLAALAVIGLAALWVRANRLALALLDHPSAAGTPVRAWVAYCPPITPRRNVEGSARNIKQNLAA